MAVLNINNPTMLDLIKSQAPDGSLIPVAEVLNQTNEGLDEMTWQEGNLTTGHVHAIRTGIPTPTWGRLYKGVTATRGTRVQVTDNTGFLEDLSEVDARLVEKHNNPLEYRASEDRPHIEGMSQEMMHTIFKGDFTDVDKFVGFEKRFNSLSADNAENIIDAGSAEDTDLTSLWLIGWSPKSCFGIVPKGSMMGLQQEDHGKVWLENGDGANGRMPVYRTYWRWDAGLAVTDWRYIVRIANIDLSETLPSRATGPDLPDLALRAMSRLPSDAFSTTRLAFYANRTLIEKWRRQVANSTDSSTLKMEEVGGQNSPASVRKKYVFDGIPVNRCDVLAPDETRVV